jgi:hypothetical protein
MVEGGRGVLAEDDHGDVGLDGRPPAPMVSVAQLRRRALRAGAAVDRMYKRSCPGGHTGVGGACVQCERRVADGATRATKNRDTPCTTWTSFERN